MSYVDGFVIPVPKEKLAAYRALARKAGADDQDVMCWHGSSEGRDGSESGTPGLATLYVDRRGEGAACAPPIRARQVGISAARRPRRRSRG